MTKVRSKFRHGQKVIAEIGGQPHKAVVDHSLNKLLNKYDHESNKIGVRLLECLCNTRLTHSGFWWCADSYVTPIVPVPKRTKIKVVNQATADILIATIIFAVSVGLMVCKVPIISNPIIVLIGPLVGMYLSLRHRKRR